MAETREGPPKEGTDLLRYPKSVNLPNGRLRCGETGHELLPKDKESYARTKWCRVALIDFTISRSKPPFNFFEQDPLNRS